jgi:hypothetical protein
VPRASRRILFADVFGLTCWVVDGAGDEAAGSDDGAAGPDLVGPGSGSGCGSVLGALMGIVNRSPKSAFWT